MEWLYGTETVDIAADIWIVNKCKPGGYQSIVSAEKTEEYAVSIEDEEEEKEEQKEEVSLDEYVQKYTNISLNNKGFESLECTSCDIINVAHDIGDQAEEGEKVEFVKSFANVDL